MTSHFQPMSERNPGGPRIVITHRFPAYDEKCKGDHFHVTVDLNGIRLAHYEATESENAHVKADAFVAGYIAGSGKDYLIVYRVMANFGD